MSETPRELPSSGLDTPPFTIVQQFDAFVRGLRPPPPPEGEGGGSGPNGSCGRRVTKPNETSNSSQSDSDWEEWWFHFAGGGGRAGKKERAKISSRSEENALMQAPIDNSVVKF